MAHRCLSSRRPGAGNDIDQPTRRTRPLAKHTEDKRAQWRQLRRLDDNAIACRDRGSDLPSAGKERRVPRRDLDHDADGLMACVVQMRRGHRDDFAVQLVRPAAIVLEHFRDFPDLSPDIADRPAGGTAFDLGDCRGMVADLTGDFEHDPPASGCGQPHPLLLRLGRRIDCSVDNAIVRVPVGGEHLSGSRIGQVDLVTLPEHGFAPHQAADVDSSGESTQQLPDPISRILCDLDVTHLFSLL